jgi:2-polyprenyl-6-methoxyphenol hydroxylase-like FAD-dependent oxidoreductase
MSSTVVVIGAGTAGCLAARALRGVADRVVLLERDRLPMGPEPRAGVPQGRHAHLLQHGGRIALEALLPGLGEELLDRGAVSVRLTEDLRWLSSAGWMPQISTRKSYLSCTRPVLDWAVRQRVLAEPSVVVEDGTEVTGLLGGPHGVTGVRVRPRGFGPERERAERELAADLVVDASGRSSATPERLAGLGLPVPEEELVDAGIGYATRLFRRPAAGFSPSFSLYLQAKAPESLRGGVLLPVEGDRWIVSLHAARGAEVPTDEAGFDAFTATLRDPALSEVLAKAEPEGPVRGFHPGGTIRRHYERNSVPGLLVLGDAACTFNPVYGQGLAVAALTALAVRDALGGSLDAGAVGRAQRAVARTTRNPWLLGTTEDARFPHTRGAPSGRLLRLLHRYLDRVLARASHDEEVLRAFGEVMSLAAPPNRLFRPAVLLGALRG